jgi:altronate dehydratase large subunit
MIASRVKGCMAIFNQLGCGQVDLDLEQTARTLVGLGRNPNVAAVLVVGLGCEGLSPWKLAEDIAQSRKPVEIIIIQEIGGTVQAVEEGLKTAGKLVEFASKRKRDTVGAKEIVMGIECGGSDATSGIAANPAVGVASDLLIQAGGTSIFSETPELIGAEHILAKRAVNDDVAKKLLEIVARFEEKLKSTGLNIRGSQPSPGNIEGGITTLEEKSLGCVHKAGSSPLQGVLEYADAATGKGLYFMDTAGYDIESIPAMIAGGAEVIVFTTGRGTPTGAPIAPVVKVTGNSRTYQRMKDNIDVNAGTIIDGSESIEEVGLRIYEEILAVASGKQTKAETLGFIEFGISRVGPTT